METALARLDVRVGGGNGSMVRAFDFDQVVEEFKRKIYALGLDLTGNHHDAEDLAQETFVRAYKGMRRFRGEAAVGTWLYRIAVNTHIDRARRKSEAVQARQPSWDDDGLSLPSPVADRPDADPERLAESVRIQRCIEKALQQLSPQQRSVFVLRHYQNLKLREIAEVLGCSDGTVKTVLFRAIRRLRDELSEFAERFGSKEDRR